MNIYDLGFGIPVPGDPPVYNMNLKTVPKGLSNYIKEQTGKKPTAKQLGEAVKVAQMQELASLNPMSSNYSGKAIIPSDKTKTPNKEEVKVTPLTEEELKEHPIDYLREKTPFIRDEYRKYKYSEDDMSGIPSDAMIRDPVGVPDYYIINDKVYDYFGVDKPTYDKMWVEDPIGLYNKAIDRYERYKKYKSDRQDFYEKGLAAYANSLIDAAIPLINRPYRNLTGRNIKPFDESPNGLLNQLGRWYSRHKLGKEDPQRLSGKGADIVSLNDNVLRMSPESKQSTGLFNEFVETRNPSIYKASDLKSGKVKSFGDSYIPFNDISLYAGVEDGKYKVDKLENFKDNTYVYPARNIKDKYSAPIKKFNVDLDDAERNFFPTAQIDVYDFNNEHPEVFDRIMYENVDKLNKLMGENRFEYNDETKDVFFDGKPVSARGGLDNGYKAANDFMKATGISHLDPKMNWFFSVRDADPELLAWEYPKIFKSQNGSPNSMNKYTVTDINDNTYPVSNLNAAILDNKMVWGNPNGGVFIGSFKDMSDAQLDSLNAYLEKNPSWLVRPDLGSFDTYRLDNPSLESYLQQYFEHPKADDPNVFTVGTTTPNRIWGSAHAYGGSLDANPEKPPVNSDLDTKYDTKLPKEKEQAYAQWVESLPLNLRDDHDYDLRGAFLEGLKPDKYGHMSDKYKKPWHPTFSNESIYSTKDMQGGHWEGDEFVPSPWQEKRQQLINSMNLMEPNTFSNGGTIHIKPENKGKFTAAAKRAGKSVQGYASQILANPENYSPTLRKRAQFAHNSAKWHACGGKLYPDGGPIDPPWASFVPSQPREPQVVRPQQQANPYLLGLSAGMGRNEAAKYSTAAQTLEFQQGYYDGQAQVAASEAVKAGRAPVVEPGIEVVSPGLDLSPVGDIRALVDAGEYYQATGDLKTALGLAALGVVAMPGVGKAAERAGREFLDDVTSKEVQQFAKNRERLSGALEFMKNYGKQNVPKPTGTLNYSIPSPEPMLNEVPYRLTITPPRPNPMRSLPEPRTFINPDGTVITPGGAVFTPTIENPVNRLSAVEKQKLIKSVGDIDFNPKTEPKANPTTTTTSSAPSTTQDIGNSKKRLKKVSQWMKDNPWKTSAIFAIPTFLGTMPFWDDIGNKVELSNQRKENPGIVINPEDTVYQDTNTDTLSDIDTTSDKYAANRALVENMAALDHDEIEWGKRQLDSVLNTKHTPMDSLIWENWVRQAIEDSAARQNNYRR